MVDTWKLEIIFEGSKKIAESIREIQYAKSVNTNRENFKLKNLTLTKVIVPKTQINLGRGNMTNQNKTQKKRMSEEAFQELRRKAHKIFKRLGIE